jgi:hypothetical protein
MDVLPRNLTFGTRSGLRTNRGGAIRSSARRLKAFGAGHFGIHPTVTLNGYQFRYAGPVQHAEPALPANAAQKGGIGRLISGGAGT